jgi:TolA-binding protein
MEPLSDLERMGRETAAFQDRWLEAQSDHERERERFVGASVARRSPGGRRVLLLVAAAVMMGLGALIFFRARTAVEQPVAIARPPLRLTIGDRAGSADTWFAAQPDKPLALAFSDGSSASFEPGARGRVAAIDGRGATLLVETGRARFEITHRPAARWLVQLGPFAVHVLGTKFDVDWDPAEQRLTLVMHEGSVKVTGCALGEGKPLAGGETLRALCRARQWQIGRSEPEAAPKAPAPERDVPETAAVLPKNPARPSAGANTEPPSTLASGEDWHALARQGRYADAIVAVEALDFNAQCERLSGADLRSLADTARLAGRLDRAGQAYRALRQRFAGQELASTAAFSLGRMAFDQQRAYADAARWFEVYLHERPNAPLAREARGRLMEALVRTGDRARAARVAEQYLGLHPDGPHAELARQLVQH